MSGSADVTSGVQKKYLTVKSADFNVDTRANDYVYLDVEFPEPLQHVHELALQSAIIPNEFFNVREGQNTLTLAWMNKTGTRSRAITVTIVPGLYTLDKLATAVQEKFAGSTETLNGVNSVIQVVRQGSDYATNYDITKLTSAQLVGTGGNAANQGYYVLVHVATEQNPFHTSIAARLGFTRAGVITTYETPINSGNAGSTRWDNAPAVFNLTTLFEMLLQETSVFEELTDQLVETDSNITYSMLSGSEVYETILLHCDLLSNSTLVTGHASTGAHPAPTTVNRSDILAVIPNNANIGASTVFVRPSEHYGGHAINQHRPITKMRLWLSDSGGKPFRHYELADWTAVLEFTIVEHVPDIMRQVAQLNQNKSFQSRHMPMALG